MERWWSMPPQAFHPLSFWAKEACMSSEKRGNLAVGLLLVLVGVWFLVIQFVPGIAERLKFDISWPLIVVGVGLFLLVLGLLVGAPGMAIPACIVGGIGGILYWQNATGNWGSWTYAWALIPGFVGVGIVLAGLLGEGRDQIKSGLGLLGTSLVLFVLFFMFFGGYGLEKYWPVAIIVLGLWLLVRSLFGKK